MQPLLNIAIRAARRAGEIIVRGMNRLHRIDVQRKGQNDFVSEIDLAAERDIIETIRKHYPDHAVLAEESGQIIPMGEWILREACREAASWEQPLQIAINLSPVQFRHGDLPAMVHSVLLETGLAPARLELEITEGVLIGDYSRALSILRRLKTLGVRIAMDDFGTGYSSLSYLQSFPFDKIKIDRSFMRDLKSKGDSLAIIKAVIGLGHSLGMSTTAEGIETEEQLAAVREQGCNEVQGFLFSPPVSAAAVTEMLDKEAARPKLRRVS